MKKLNVLLSFVGSTFTLAVGSSILKIVSIVLKKNSHVSQMIVFQILEFHYSFLDLC